MRGNVCNCKLGLLVLLALGFAACAKQEIEDVATPQEVSSTRGNTQTLELMYSEQLTPAMEESPIGQMAADYYADLLAVSYSQGAIRSYLSQKPRMRGGGGRPHYCSH